MNKEPENCWEFWNCPEEIRNNCEIFKLNAGKECWFLSNSSKGCKRSKGNGGWFNCEWFKKNNQIF